MGDRKTSFARLVEERFTGWRRSCGGGASVGASAGAGVCAGGAPAVAIAPMEAATQLFFSARFVRPGSRLETLLGLWWQG